MNNKEYAKYAEKHAKKSPIFKNCATAFITGGAICTLGQGMFDLMNYFGLNEESITVLVPSSLVFISCMLTGAGLYDRIAKYAGAGTLVPITGFANAVCSPAIDNKAEGFILGMGAKMFVIAGPVIVYGTVASVIFGIIFYVLKLFGIDITGMVI